MNELASLGLILLFALLAGHLVKELRIPEVTGYLLAGMVLGPSGVGWVDAANLDALEVVSEVTLGLILLSVGSVFEADRFRDRGGRVVGLTLAESLLASLLVGGGLTLLGLPWQAALLLGAMAIETAPGSTLMVIRECRGSGPVSQTLLGVIAVNNVCCLMVFSVVASIIDVTGSGTSSPWEGLYVVSHSIVWQVGASAALGYLVGLVLAFLAIRATEHGERLMLLAGVVLVCVGVAHWLELSPLVAALAVGATMVNLSRQSHELLDALARTDPPLYAIFFVLAGADLDVGAIGSMGLVGAYYLAARMAGKLAGARLGARVLGFEPVVHRWLGVGLLAQAGLAVGLTLAVGRRFPEHAAIVNTVVLAAVVVYEIIGPLGTRLAIVRSGEAQADPGERVDELI